jgi:SAM-dependent methyltransferase
MVVQAIRRFPGVAALINVYLSVETWSFDLRHRSDTAPELAEQARRGWMADTANHSYLPIRPGAARRELKALPLDDLRDYSFIDIGCGKGRMLLVASALPFRRFVGIELRKEIYDQAVMNFRRNPRAASQNVECMNINALDFEFPDEKMVIYLFNPFGKEVLRDVLNNLGRSLDRHFRDVIVVLHWTNLAYVADSMSHLCLVKEGRRFRMYRSRKV